MKHIEMKRFCIVWGLLLLFSNVMASEVVTLKADMDDTNTWMLSVGLEGEGPSSYCGFQMDVALPEGVSYREGSIEGSSRIEGFSLLVVPLANGVLRIVGYSPTQQSISEEAGTLFTLVLSSESKINPGDVAILKNIRFSDAVGTEVVLAKQSVELPASLESVMEDTASCPIYTLQGVRFTETDLRDLPSGVYIVRGRKIFVK